MKKELILIMAMLLLGCANEKDGGGESPEKVIRSMLLKGEGEEVLRYLKENGGALPECERHYASLLGNFLVFMDKISALAGNASLPSATDYLSAVYYQFVEPLEGYLKEVDREADEVIFKRCTFVTEEGVKIEFGKEGEEYHLKVVLGDEWDEGEAMLFSCFANVILAGIDFLFSHAGEIHVLQVPAIYEEEPLATMRELGGFFDLNPRLLEFSKNPDLRKRFSDIPFRIKKISEYLYSNGGTKGSPSDDTGFLSYLLMKEDEIQEDEVLGLIDRGKKGEIDIGDEFVVGIKSFDAEMINFPNVTSGVRLKVTYSIYPVVKKTLEVMKEYLQTVWDQMSALENPSHPYARLSFKPLNEFLEVVNLPPVPEVIEVDLVHFFTDPKPLRKLLPYWYDDDGDPATPKKFVIEGESPVDRGFHFIYIQDVPHFPDTFTFTYTPQEPKVISGVRIPEDGIFPSGNYVLPYIAFQDPTFNSSLYVNPSRTGEGENQFLLPDHYLINRAIGVLVNYLNQGL